MAGRHTAANDKAERGSGGGRKAEEVSRGGGEG